MRLQVRSVRRALAFALPVLLLGAAAHGQTAPARIFGVPAATLASSDAVRHVVASAVADSARTIVVEVPLYAAPDGSFDGLTAVIRAAHDRGLTVHASVATNVVTGVDELPPARDHVLYQHPEWLMVPRTIAPEMLGIDLRSPGYIGRLARWARANAARVSGLYLSALSPAAADYAAAAVVDLLRKYPFDALDIHAAPCPDEEFDYSRQALDLFRSDVRSRLSAAERAHMDEIESIDPFAYPDEFPDDWRQFRRARLDDLISRVTASARSARPSVLLAAGADPASTPDSH